MKRLIMLLLCLSLLTGSAPADAVTIEGMELVGGNQPFHSPWIETSAMWNTFFLDGMPELGVSSQPGGPLLNLPSTAVSGLAFGNYYLYADPEYFSWLSSEQFYILGNRPVLVVSLSDGTSIYANFEVVGQPGSGTAWTWTGGDPAITLGWASGSANLVTPSGEHPSQFEIQLHPDAFGNPDYYLKVGIHAGAVPLPGAVWLLGSGLLGLVGLRRFRKG